MGQFSLIEQAPEDPIFGLNALFARDTRQEKIHLGIGVYRDDLLQVPMLQCVQEAEKIVIDNQSSKNYLGVEGDSLFIQQTAQMILGKHRYLSYHKQLSCMQSIGGSGALRIAGELLMSMGVLRIHIPDPSWPNHGGIFSQCGLEVHTYPYYDFARHDVAFEEIVHYFSSLTSGSAVLLQVNCHNPTGADLRKRQWEALATLCKEKQILPVLDAAYLGFEQSVEEDAFPIQLFIDRNIECLISFSCSKNFALYAERVGLFMAFSMLEEQEAVLSRCKHAVRTDYSNPPMHGAAIVAHILQTPFLKEMWDKELLQMRQRIFEMRNNFVMALAIEGSAKDYSYLLHKNGMFSFCDLSEDQVQKLIQDYAIYITKEGRINLAGLNFSSLSYVAKAIVAVGG